MSCDDVPGTPVSVGVTMLQSFCCDVVDALEAFLIALVSPVGGMGTSARKIE